MMRGLMGVVMVIALLASGVSASAEVIAETWRGGAPTFMPRSIAIDPTDGSCWISDSREGVDALHIAQDGTRLLEIAGHTAGVWYRSLSVNATDGSLWEAADSKGKVLHFSRDGDLLWEGSSFRRPSAISANSGDGSCWVGDSSAHQVVHLAADGTELSRSYEGSYCPDCLSVNIADGSCWLAEDWIYGDGVVHLSANGGALWRSDASTFPTSPACVSVNPSDGSCWVGGSGHVTHLAQDGTVLWQNSGDLPPVRDVSVNPVDGSCWIASEDRVIHVAADGEVLGQSTGSAFTPNSISVNPTDGSCWVVDTPHSQLVHLDPTGSELWRSVGYPGAIPMLPASAAVNSADGSCWVSDASEGSVIHLGQDGSVLWSSYYVSSLDFSNPTVTAVNPADDSCWVATYDISSNGVQILGPTIAHLSSAGDLLWMHWYNQWPFSSISANPTDGSCWISQLNDPAWGRVSLSHLDKDGNELVTGGLWFGNPTSLSVNSTDGSCWVADAGDSTIVHVASNYTAIWTSAPTYSSPSSVSVNSTEGSCWVADTGNNQIVHLASDGSELWRSAGAPTFSGPTSVSVDLKNGSCWVADTGNNRIVHLAHDGSELWNSTQLWHYPGTPTFSAPSLVSADSTDGACWVLDAGNGQLVRLAPITEVSPAAAFEATPRSGPQPLIVTFTDHSTGNLVLWSWSFGDGTSSVARNPEHQYLRPGNYAVSLTVTDVGSNTTTQTGSVLVGFPDTPTSFWATEQIVACASAGIVGGYGDGLYHPDWPVTRDQMAVYIARALAGGDESVPTGPAEATFDDVPNTGYGDAGTDPHWAYKYVEYAVDSNVVQGYAHDDPENPGEIIYRYEPTWTVTRDQMAVYVARAMVAPTGEAALADYVPADARNFPDVPNTGCGDDKTDPFWAYTHIEYCVEHGVVSGYEDGYYRPEWVVTRDQMAVYVARALGGGG